MKIFRLILFALLLFSLAGCVRSHQVERRVSSAPMKEATLADLVGRINGDAGKVKTMNATVDITTSVGGAKKGDVTDYQSIRGYVLVRKPAMLRMIGLFPVVRNRAFDMVSDGREFRLSIPPKNKFIVGKNDVVIPSKNALENLRPQHIFDALLLREIDPRNEVAVLEVGSEVIRDPKTHKEVDQPTYVVTVVRRDPSDAPNGQDRHDQGWYLSRKVIFSRVDLVPHRQIVYDKFGNVASEALYEGFTDYDGVSFPSLIRIRRPQEEYTIQLGIVKLRLNEPLSDEQFSLQQPAGSQLVRLDTQHASATPTPPAPIPPPESKPR